MAGETIVAKFGGTSVGSVSSILQVRDIVRADPRRTCIVVSAPAGITDMLTAWLEPFNAPNLKSEVKLAQQRFGTKDKIIADIRRQFLEIVNGLDLSLDINGMFDDIEARCAEQVRENRVLGTNYDYVLSRGEWTNAKIVAEVLEYEFVDAADFLVVNWAGKWRPTATRRRMSRIGLSKKLGHGIVIGGFYGCRWPEKDWIVTFSRGGSDITGAMLANLLGASVYENWTDVPGVLTADPRVVSGSRKIDRMSYRELLEMAYTGAKVFHPSAIRPVAELGIPVHIRCTMTPDIEGTWVVPTVEREPGTITGVAHRNGLTQVKLEKNGMNDEEGFDQRLNRALLKMKINFHHKQTGIDSMTVVVPTEQVLSREAELTDLLRKLCNADTVDIEHGLAMVCVVGSGMVHAVGVAAKIFTALAESGINIQIIDQGGSEINVAIGVHEAYGPGAVSSIHKRFFFD